MLNIVTKALNFETVKLFVTVLGEMNTWSIASTASDVFSFSAGYFRQLTRISNTLWKTKSCAASSRPFAKPTSQPSWSVPSK